MSPAHYPEWLLTKGAELAIGAAARVALRALRDSGEPCRIVAYLDSSGVIVAEVEPGDQLAADSSFAVVEAAVLRSLEVRYASDQGSLYDADEGTTHEREAVEAERARVRAERTDREKALARERDALAHASFGRMATDGGLKRSVGRPGGGR